MDIKEAVKVLRERGEEYRRDGVARLASLDANVSLAELAEHAGDVQRYAYRAETLLAAALYLEQEASKP